MRPSIWVLLLIFLFGCGDTFNDFIPNDAVPLYPRGDVNAFFDNTSLNPDTLFTVNNDGSWLLRTTNGVLLEGQPGSFIHNDGSPVESPVTIQWKQIRAIAEQVAERISLVFNDQLLSSELIFKLEAFADGKTVSLTQPVIIKWPNPNPAQDALLLIKDVENPYLWQQPQQSSLGISSWTDPVSGSGTNGFLIPLEQPGIYTVCKYLHIPPSHKGPLKVQHFPSYNVANTVVYLLDRQLVQVYALQDAGEGVFILPDLPLHGGRVITITAALKNTWFSAWKEIPFENGPEEWSPRPKSMQPSSIWTAISTY